MKILLEFYNSEDQTTIVDPEDFFDNIESICFNEDGTIRKRSNDQIIGVWASTEN